MDEVKDEEEATEFATESVSDSASVFPMLRSEPRLEEIVLRPPPSSD